MLKYSIQRQAHNYNYNNIVDNNLTFSGNCNVKQIQIQLVCFFCIYTKVYELRARYNNAIKREPNITNSLRLTTKMHLVSLSCWQSTRYYV